MRKLDEHSNMDMREAQWKFAIDSNTDEVSSAMLLVSGNIEFLDPENCASCEWY